MEAENDEDQGKNTLEACVLCFSFDFLRTSCFILTKCLTYVYYVYCRVSITLNRDRFKAEYNDRFIQRYSLVRILFVLQTKQSMS